MKKTILILALIIFIISFWYNPKPRPFGFNTLLWVAGVSSILYCMYYYAFLKTKK